MLNSPSGMQKEGFMSRDDVEKVFVKLAKDNRRLNVLQQKSEYAIHEISKKLHSLKGLNMDSELDELKETFENRFKSIENDNKDNQYKLFDELDEKVNSLEDKIEKIEDQKMASMEDRVWNFIIDQSL